MRRFFNWLRNLTKTVYGIFIATVVFSASAVGVATFVLQAPSLWRDFWKEDKEQISSKDDLLCREVFLSSSNYKIVVLPFFKTCETGRDVGLEIRNRLELLKYKDSLNIDVCYLDTFKQDPNFTKEKADRVRKKYNADQIIYGMNGSLNCTPQDTLLEVCVNYVSDKESASIKPISINQVKASLSDIRQGFLQADIDFIVYYFSASSDAQKGRYVQSLAKLSKVSNSNNHAKYYALKGYVNEELGNYDSALVNYNKALKLEVTFDNLYQRASLYRIHLDKTDLAILDLNKATVITKDSSQLGSAFFCLGAAFYEVSKFDSSIKYIDLNLKYSKLTKDTKSDFAAMYAVKGHDLLSLNKNEAANTSFDNSLKLDSNYNLAIEGKAQYYEESIEYEKAISSYNKLIKTDSSVYRYYIERGSLLERTNKSEKAKKDYLKALKIAKYSSIAYQSIGREKRENGYSWESLYILKTAAEKYPKDSNIFFEIGLTYSDLDILKEAAFYYSKAITIYSHHNPALYNRGVLYVQMGKYKEAISDFDKYIASKAYEPQVHYWRGVAKSVIGDKSGLDDLNKASLSGVTQAKEIIQLSGIAM